MWVGLWVSDRGLLVGGVVLLSWVRIVVCFRWWFYDAVWGFYVTLCLWVVTELFACVSLVIVLYLQFMFACGFGWP